MPFLPPNQQRQSTEDTVLSFAQNFQLITIHKHLCCMGVLCKWAKLLTDLQILGCELHKNAFNGPAPPGTAEGAILLGIESAPLSEDEYEDKMPSRILANNRQKTSDDGTCFFLHVTSIFSLLLQLLLSAERRKLGACCFNATRMCDGGGAVQYVWTTDEINSISQFETRPSTSGPNAALIGQTAE